MNMQLSMFLNQSEHVPLMRALLARDLDTLKQLLVNGEEANISFADCFGRTPLMIAVLLDDVSSVFALLEHSNLDRQDHAGMTALMIACEHGYSDCVSTIAPLAQINLIDKTGRTALMCASYYGFYGCIDALMNFNPNPVLQDFQGRNALSISVLRSYVDCALRLSSLPGYDDCDKQGVTPLMHACMTGQQNVVQVLLKRADLDRIASSGHGANALSLAAYHGHMTCVKMLLSAGADPNAADRFGMTVLMKAAIGRGYALDALRLLVDLVDPRIRDIQGRTASDYAKRYQHQERAWLLDTRCHVLEDQEALSALSCQKGRFLKSKHRL